MPEGGAMIVLKIMAVVAIGVLMVPVVLGINVLQDALKSLRGEKDE